jgi:two-component system, NarL family, nitrate/nitrite response regulator NarL
MPRPIRIGLLTDHPMFAEGVTRALEASTNLTVVARGRTAADAFHIAKDATLDILLLEIEVPGVGIDGVRQMCHAKCHAKVIVLTALDDEGLVVGALRAGAQGYLLKDVTGADLRRAIESVHRGEPHVTLALASRTLRSMVEKRANLFTSHDLVGLTAREHQVLAYLSQGLTNQEIGLKLGINVKTVKHYTVTLFAKMGVRNRVEAAAAMRIGDLSDVHVDGRVAQ